MNRVFSANMSKLKFQTQSGLQKKKKKSPTAGVESKLKFVGEQGSLQEPLVVSLPPTSCDEDFGFRIARKQGSKPGNFGTNHSINDTTVSLPVVVNFFSFVEF